MWKPVHQIVSSLSRPQQHPLAEDTMLAFLLSEIDVRTKRIEQLISGTSQVETVLEEIKQSLDHFMDRFSHLSPSLNDSAWNEAYRLERLLVLIEPEENLLSELRRRAGEATDELLASAPRLRAAIDATAPLAIDTSTLPPLACFLPLS